MRDIQTVPATSDATGATDLSAAIRVSPNGKFLYASNRGRDSIIAYRIDGATGLLSFVSSESSGGFSPRDFIIDPTGAFLLTANQDSDNLSVFLIDPASGKLAKIASVEIPSPSLRNGLHTRPERTLRRPHAQCLQEGAKK